MLEAGLHVFLLCALCSLTTAIGTAVCLWMLLRKDK